MKYIPLTQGKYTVVDDEDYDLAIHKWCFHGGYAKRNAPQVNNIRSKQISMHRAIMNAPDNMEVDHINGNKLDNRKSNLRLATRAQNMWNRPNNQDNVLGLKGISYEEKSKSHPYEVSIVGNGIRFRQRCATITEAVDLYNQKVVEIHGEFAVLNEVSKIESTV